MSSARRGAGRLTGAVLLGVLLAGCQGAGGADGEPGPGTGHPPPTASPDRGEGTAPASGGAPGQDDPLGPAPEAAEPRVTATGTLPTVEGQVEVGVVSVGAVGEHTRLVWTLRSADGADLAVDYMNGLAGAGGTTDDVRAARLELADGTRLETLLTGTDEDGTVVTLGCLCSRMPSSLTGSWTVLTSTFPAVPEGTEQVTLQLPGADGDEGGIRLTDLPLGDG